MFFGYQKTTISIHICEDSRSWRLCLLTKISLLKILYNPRKVNVAKRDYDAENVKGIQLLKQRLSNSKR